MDGAAKQRYQTAFGDALAAQLAKSGMTQNDLATALGCSPSYVSQTINGRRLVAPQWAHTVTQKLALTPDERAALLRAGATDHVNRINSRWGDLDLRKKKGPAHRAGPRPPTKR